MHLIYTLSQPGRVNCMFILEMEGLGLRGVKDWLCFHIYNKWNLSHHIQLSNLGQKTHVGHCMYSLGEKVLLTSVLWKF